MPQISLTYPFSIKWLSRTAVISGATMDTPSISSRPPKSIRTASSNAPLCCSLVIILRNFFTTLIICLSRSRRNICIQRKAFPPDLSLTETPSGTGTI